MANPSASVPSFLREAFVGYSSYNNPQKQEVHKKALKWLQTQIENDLEDKTILEQFAVKWRAGSNADIPDKISLEFLPSSYKGDKTLDYHQEEALVFMQEVIPLSLQEEFQKHWEIKNKLEVSNSAGTAFKVDNREISVLQAEDAEGTGITWFQVPKKQVYFLLSSELQDNQYLVVLSEKISPQNRDTWYVAQEDIKISGV
jgi:hypothetical protein